VTETVTETASTIPSAESRNLAVVAHLSAFVALLGIPSLVGPLAVWLWKQNEDPFAADQAKEALNFNISFLIYTVVSGIAILLLVGIVLLPAVIVTWFVLVIVAAVQAGNGQTYRYPLTMRFVA
jgi:hypothetical protein